MSGAPKIYGKDDLRKLADSKAVPLIAHSHEVIVPVVYSGMVKKFLEEKGVKLPLTQSQLAEMKREAKAVGTKDVGHAKGGVVKQSQKVTQKVIVNLAPHKKRKRVKRRKFSGLQSGIINPPSGEFNHNFFNQLRPNNYASIRPLTSTGYVQPPIIPDYKREAEENMKREKEALEKYKNELSGKHHDVLKDLEKQKQEHAQRFEALFRPASSVPIRSGFDTPPVRPYDSYPGTPAVLSTSYKKQHKQLLPLKSPDEEKYDKLDTLYQELAELRNTEPDSPQIKRLIKLINKEQKKRDKK